jgi:dolichol-phosphate mannosyltransferase
VASFTVIILAFNESNSLKQTVHEVLALTEEWDTEVIISTSHAATEECKATALSLQAATSNLRVHFQIKPYVAAAVLECVSNITTDYTIYMSADMETPAYLIPDLIRETLKSDADVVSGSRWVEGGKFTDYGRAKYWVSFAAQKFCKAVFVSNLTEFTYGYRIYKTNVLKELIFKETKHPFFLESLLIPLKMKYKIVEIPVMWQPRVEGKSVVNLMTLILYLRPIFRVRFTRSGNLRRNW